MSPDEPILQCVPKYTATCLVNYISFSDFQKFSFLQPTKVYFYIISYLQPTAILLAVTSAF